MCAWIAGLCAIIIATFGALREALFAHKLADCSQAVGRKATWSPAGATICGIVQIYWVHWNFQGAGGVLLVTGEPYNEQA